MPHKPTIFIVKDPNDPDGHVHANDTLSNIFTCKSVLLNEIKNLKFDKLPAVLIIEDQMQDMAEIVNILYEKFSCVLCPTTSPDWAINVFKFLQPWACTVDLSLGSEIDTSIQNDRLRMSLRNLLGFKIITGIKTIRREVSPVVVSQFKREDYEKEAISLGATYYVEKYSSRFSNLADIVDNAMRAFLLLSGKYPPKLIPVILKSPDLISEGTSQEVLKILEKKVESFDLGEFICSKQSKIYNVICEIMRFADTDVQVLILGETGVGKEEIARLIHNNSPRKNQQFLIVNIANLPENLIETELFGYKKGAFTGAVADKIGKLKLADKGTLFIDEVGEIPMSVQHKLLEFFEKKELRMVGSPDPKPDKVDVRIISATNDNLQDRVNKKSFRPDLYFRLKVVEIEVPPLRERKEDIPLLIEYFLKKFSDSHKRNINAISNDAMMLLLAYAWPGNVRELEHLIENVVARSFPFKGKIEIDDLPNYIRQFKKSTGDQKDNNLILNLTPVITIDSDKIKNQFKDLCSNKHNIELTFEMWKNIRNYAGSNESAQWIKSVFCNEVSYDNFKKYKRTLNKLNNTPGISLLGKLKTTTEVDDLLEKLKKTDGETIYVRLKKIESVEYSIKIALVDILCHAAREKVELRKVGVDFGYEHTSDGLYMTLKRDFKDINKEFIFSTVMWKKLIKGELK